MRSKQKTKNTIGNTVKNNSVVVEFGKKYAFSFFGVSVQIMKVRANEDTNYFDMGDIVWHLNSEKDRVTIFPVRWTFLLFRLLRLCRTSASALNLKWWWQYMEKIRIRVEADIVKKNWKNRTHTFALICALERWKMHVTAFVRFKTT